MAITPRLLTEAAREYHERYGMYVIPAHHPIFHADGTVTCSCGRQHAAGKNGKEPAVKWVEFQHKRPWVGQIGRWWQGAFTGYNIAAVQGKAAMTILLDWDGLIGYASQRELEKELGDLPPTPTVMTGGGGSHMIYRHPGVYVPTRKNLRECFDVRGDGGISILPPSQHEFGEYVWECDMGIGDVPIADLPQAWIDFITADAVDMSVDANVSSKQVLPMKDVQWTAAPDGTTLVSDGRETFMRDKVWESVIKLMQQTGVVPTADELLVEAVQAYMPYVDLSRPGRGLDELRVKCAAAVAKLNRKRIVIPPKRGLTKPFLIRR